MGPFKKELVLREDFLSVEEPEWALKCLKKSNLQSCVCETCLCENCTTEMLKTAKH